MGLLLGIQEETIKKFAEKNFSEFKDNLSQLIVDKIEPISIEIKKLLNEKSYLDKILLDGSKKANFQASDKVKKIHEIIGF
jgi:tryptophanyl-tRNA synthetase